MRMTEYGVHIMVTKANQEKAKKTSRGMRKHVRRMKQESRKTGIPVNELKKRVRLPQVPKTKKKLEAWDSIARLIICLTFWQKLQVEFFTSSVDNYPKEAVCNMSKRNQQRELATVAFEWAKIVSK